MKASLLRSNRARGYWLLEYGYAKQNNAWLPLKIKLGSLLSRRQRQPKTLASVELPADLQASITDPEGADSHCHLHLDHGLQEATTPTKHKPSKMLSGVE